MLYLPHLFVSPGDGFDFFLSLQVNFFISIK